jgi:hypothetical protein
MAIKVVYVCDVNTCETETIDTNKVFVVEIMGKQYHFCKKCYDSITQFIGKCLNEGTEVEEKEDDEQEKLKKALQELIKIQPPTQPPQDSVNPYANPPITRIGTNPNVEWDGNEYTVPNPPHFTITYSSVADEVKTQYNLK